MPKKIDSNKLLYTATWTWKYNINHFGSYSILAAPLPYFFSSLCQIFILFMPTSSSVTWVRQLFIHFHTACVLFRFFFISFLFPSSAQLSLEICGRKKKVHFPFFLSCAFTAHLNIRLQDIAIWERESRKKITFLLQIDLCERVLVGNFGSEPSKRGRER